MLSSVAQPKSNNKRTRSNSTKTSSRPQSIKERNKTRHKAKNKTNKNSVHSKQRKLNRIKTEGYPADTAGPLFDTSLIGDVNAIPQLETMDENMSKLCIEFSDLFHRRLGVR